MNFINKIFVLIGCLISGAVLAMSSPSAIHRELARLEGSVITRAEITTLFEAASADAAQHERAIAERKEALRRISVPGTIPYSSGFKRKMCMVVIAALALEVTWANLWPLLMKKL